MQPTPAEIQQVFRLAYYLHPQREIALRITQAALCDSFPVLQQGQDKRHKQRGILSLLPRRHALRPYKLSLPRQGLLQMSVYHTSARWERDQEAQTFCLPGQRYHPTHDDLLIRYITHLVACSLERHVVYGALALGCHLYQYSPTHISQLAPDLFLEDNIRRAYSKLLGWMQQRFPTLPIDQRPPFGTRKVRTRPPSDDERCLVRDTLEQCTPWWTSCLEPGVSLLALFTPSSLSSEQTGLESGHRLHALLHPLCAGLERFIHAYNQEKPAMPLDPPYDRLEVPAFPPQTPPGPTTPVRTNPAPLSAETVVALQETFLRQQQRRHHVQARLLRVYVDGVYSGQWHPHDSAGLSLEVSEHALYLDIYAQDQEGELLVAVFALGTLLTAEDSPSVCRVQQAGGQTVTLTALSAGTTTAAGSTGWRVRVTYRVALWRRLWLAWGGGWQRGQNWLQRCYARRLVPTYATGLLLLLSLSTGWLGALYWHQQRQPRPEQWRGGAPTTATLLVEFQADTPVYEIQVLLHALSGRIVDGPTIDGRYRVEVALHTPGPAARDAVLQSFRQRGDILRFVEPLPGTP